MRMCRLDVAGTCYLRGTRHFRLMTNPRTLVCVGFLLAATSAFAQSGSPAEASATTPTPTATPNVFSPQTLADLKRLQQAALSSDYAYRQVAHLSDNIGPRLSGSAQAAKAVEYVASELKAIGCEVQLEKVMVPHWVRGEETAALIQWPGQAENTTKQGPVKMKLVLTPQTLPEVESANVIGDIKGSEHPEQVVIVSGHLDSWDLGTGAIDDGAGVAVSMEAANLVHKLNLKPKRTIRVIAWMNEENGSAGSKQYAKDHEKDWANHFAAMETDGGAGHPIGLNIKAKPEVKAMLKPVAAILQESGAGMLSLAEHAGADIEPMEKAGVPAFAPIQDGRFYFNYHHTAADTLDKIVPKELAENSAVVTVTAYALANLDQPLPRPLPSPDSSP